MSRRQRASSAPDVSPTYARILDEAMATLREDGFDRFNVQQVLDRAAVSRATLYRHFSDVDGLIEAALIEVFRGVVNLYVDRFHEIVKRSSNLTDFRTSLRSALETFSLLPAEVRLQRAHTIALTATRPSLASAIASAQETLTDRWTTVFSDAQEKKLVRDDVEPRAAAVVVQSLTVGRIIDDVAISHLGDDQWARTYFDILDRAFLPQD